MCFRVPIYTIANENTARFGLNRSNTLLGLLLICAAATSMLPQQLMAGIAIVLLCVLTLTGKLYLAYPVMLFFYAELGSFLGISVYRVFSLLLIFSVLLKAHRNIKVSVKHLLPLIVLFFYIVVTISSYSIRLSVFSFVDVISALIMACYYLADAEALKHFFTVYVITALVAFFVGMIFGNSLNGYQVIGGNLVKLTRFMATFEDPNYMGFFYSVAVFGVITLRLFKPTARIILTVILYVMIFASLSITALLGNAIFWLIYFIITKKINLSTTVTVCVVVLIMLGLYRYGVNNRDVPVLGDICWRIQDKISNFQANDIDSLTTDRSALAAQHFAYYQQQNIFKILFGGNMFNTKIAELGGQNIILSHNEYVDSLLDVGLVGAAILFAFVAWRLIEAGKKYVGNREDESASLCVFMMKIIWLFYAAALTMFLDFRFMLIFFL